MSHTRSNTRHIRGSRLSLVLLFLLLMTTVWSVQADESLPPLTEMQPVATEVTPTPTTTTLPDDTVPTPPSTPEVEEQVPERDPVTLEELLGDEPVDAAAAVQRSLFPPTEAMTDTVNTVVATLSELPQPPLPPEAVLQAMDIAAPALRDANLPVNYQLYLPLLLQGAAAGDAATTQPDATTRASGADVAVTIWPAPSIRVARRGTLAYEIRLANYGNGEAASIRVNLPYNQNQFTLVNARFKSGSGDWVSSTKNNQITITFGRLKKGERRTGTIYLQVKDNLPNDTVISMRAKFDWSDGRSGGKGSSNWAPVLVGSSNDTSANQWVWLSVDPVRGRVGTTHRFFTDRFIPNEGIITWLNTPNGVKPLDLRATADSDGRVWLNFSSSGRTPGTYQLVVYGARSNLTAVGTFIVQ